MSHKARRLFATLILVCCVASYGAFLLYKEACRPLFHNYSKGGESIFGPFLPWTEERPYGDDVGWVATFDYGRDIIVAIEGAKEKPISELRRFDSSFSVVFLPSSSDAFVVSSERCALIVKRKGAPVETRSLVAGSAIEFHLRLIRNKVATIPEEISRVDEHGKYRAVQKL